MSEPREKLLSAADHIDDARTDLDYGDLDVSNENLAENVEELEEVMQVMVSTIREMALLEQVEEEIEDE